jgi:DNA-binding beta-propeller fold protein YncE
MRYQTLFPALTLTLLACTGENPSDTPSGGAGALPTCASNADCASSPDTPICDTASGACQPLPPGWQIGYRDGSPGSVGMTVIAESDKLSGPKDLAFNPSNPDELWVVNHDDDSVTVIQRPGEPDVLSKRYKDPAAQHFMHRPPAIAFGAVLAEWGQSWATCGDGNNGDYFMGPALFTADLTVFAKQTPGGLGSHLDMLHSSSYCRGIAHVEENIYWVFNDHKNSLDRYDFKQDHGPGLDDHSDGEILRYVRGDVAGVGGVSSHLFYNAPDQMLYVADTGNSRIAKLDTKSGTLGASFSGDESVVVRKYMDDAIMTDVVPHGTLEAPSGIEIKDGVLFVSDNATSRLYAFDPATGALLRHLDTGLQKGALGGFAFGPKDGLIYLVDTADSRVLRIEPQ